MHNLAHKAYGQVTRRTADPRQIETAVFEQVTEALVHVEADPNADPALWADAINRNRQLWLTLWTDLLSPGNALPDDLKTGLLNLAEFVRRTSMDVLAGGEGLADLIEINRTILAGLQARPDDAARKVA